MRYISILRGINVGGKRKIFMADLADMFRSLGFSEIVTYIQSGNVIFNDERFDIPKLESTINIAIFNRFGFDVPVIVRTSVQLNQCLQNNEFAMEENAEDKHLFVTFLKTNSEVKLAAAIHHEDFLPDRFHLRGNHVFVYCHGKYSESKLTNQFFEQKLKVPATTRNWTTVKTLAEMTTPRIFAPRCSAPTSL